MISTPNPPIPHWPGLAGREIAWARPDNLTTAPLRRIFDWWQSAATDGPPSRDAFDITQFGDIAEHLYIIAAIAGGFELRLAGEEYIRLFRLKKGWTWTVDSPDPVIRDSANLMGFVAAAKRPLRTTGRLELIERHWIELEALVCPLSAGEDGVVKFLGCTSALDGPGQTE